jgi:hypothetical protein
LRFVMTLRRREAHRERTHERTADPAPVLHEPPRERFFSRPPESG